MLKLDVQNLDIRICAYCASLHAYEVYIKVAFGKCIIKLLTILTVYQRTILFLRQLMASYLLTVLTYHKNHISKQLFALNTCLRSYIFTES